MEPIYRCSDETEKPGLILVHEPGLETKLAFEDPIIWGFDPSLKEDPRPFKKWLEDAQKEHQQMVAAIRGEGIDVAYLCDLLTDKKQEVQSYLDAQRMKILGSYLNDFERIDTKEKGIILDVIDNMHRRPVDGLLNGLESGAKFQTIPYKRRVEIYKALGTFIPQTSLYYTQDAVISSPAGLIKAKMAMWDRRQEPDILEIALGKENYIHRLKNGTEGGDVTMSAYMHGGDTLRVDGMMLFGISALSGKNIDIESEILSKKAGNTRLVKFYTPDFFNPGIAYATGNVMHLDTIMMPISSNTVLANFKMLEQSALREGDKPVMNGLEWVRENFDFTVEVPDDEQQGTYGWGSNILPLGNKKILSSTHLKKTNKKLRDAGFEVIETPLMTLTTGFGSAHCMTANL